MILPRLLVLTDRTQLPAGRSLPETVAACVRAGATHVVLREPDLPHEERAALAAQLLRIPGLVLIAARERLHGSGGVHLSATQSAVEAREASFHGCSCHNEGEIRHALAGGASYVTVSPAVPTDSKPGYGPPLGLSGIRRLSAAAGALPTFALGGITADTAASFLEAGAYGVAVMGSLMRSDDPDAMTEKLIAEVGR